MSTKKCSGYSTHQAKEIDVVLEFIPGRECHMHNQELTYTRDLANLLMSGAYESPAPGYRLGLLVSCNYEVVKV